MITHHPADDRFHTKIGWLDSRHSFSFGHHYDPSRLGFRALRVINEDKVAGGAGFPPHGHDNMEILSYVVTGALEHRDSLGNGAVIRPGELQRMSAGTGIRHAEFNASVADPVHFLQIWIEPEANGIAPGYEQKAFPITTPAEALTLIGARGGRDGAVTIHQDVDLYAGRLPAGGMTAHALRSGRHAWVQIVGGAADINGVTVAAGDAVSVSDEAAMSIAALTGTELLLFDLA